MKETYPPLELPSDIRLTDPEKTETLPEDGDIYLGIDIGSTSTDLVMTGNRGELIDFWYLRTAGNPEAAVRTGLASIRKKYGEITFRSVGVTGSGRDRMGKMIGADVIRDEITAQARGASWWIPQTDTVFEIGGQDSKFISLKDSKVVDFQMNKICAAGTGSFVEEQASRMGIPITTFGQMAMKAKSPAALGERCTVFIETAISSAAADGVPTEDIAAGLCLSIVRNYLHKVVGTKPVGKHIVLQGGVAYNPGIVAAFRAFYGDQIQVNPCFSISGAFGVAMLAKENTEITAKDKSSFKGFDFAVASILPEKHSPEVQRNINFYKKAGELLLDGYDGKLDPKKKTVGVPYVLMIHKFFPMANAFFKDLGYNVLLTKPTNEDTIFLSQQLAQSETCYPVKLIYGHMQQLVDAGVDYIFMPTIHTMKHEKSHVAHNYGCVYMQTAAFSVAKALKLEEKGITLLSPVFDLDFGKQAMAGSMVGLGKILGKPAPLCAKALLSGSMAVRKHTAAVEQLGKQILDNIRPEDKVLVLITRNYGVSDPILNMGIPELLLERGYKVLTLSHLPAHNLDISGDYPNLYWPFGQHIISGAKIIAANPNLYAVYLTNHGCGPDSMLSHLFRQEMGDKPYLQIEVDEHFSKVGVITRIEAFLNSLTSRTNRTDAAGSKGIDLSTAISSGTASIHLVPDQKLPLVLPDFGVYTPYLQEYLSSCGYAVRRLPAFTEAQLALGRSETSAKEYLPFPALLGQIMADDKENDKNSTASDCQYLVPSSRGSEADGEYAQAIYSVFRTGGKRINIAAPLLEKMPETDHFDLFCRALITGDLINLKNSCCNVESAATGTEKTADDCHIMSWEEAHLTAAEIGKKSITGRILFAAGDPYMVSVLNDGVIDTLRREGENVLIMSLLEYYLMLWMDQEEASSSAVKQKLEFISGHIRAFHQELGKRSVFSPDIESLKACAEHNLPKFDGGNGRYRYAKCLEMGDRCSAILHISPRYENADVILEQRGLSVNCKAPIFSMQMDGDWDETAWNRLRSFLYYCR